jgi:hypothetical protein
VSPAAQTLVVPLSPAILITLLLILGLSVWVFATLVKRETRRRRAIALAQWARSKNLRVIANSTDLPALSPLKSFNSRAQAIFTSSALTLAQVHTSNAGLTTAAAAPRLWNVILRTLPAPWPTTALRPTAHEVSFVDLFSLSSFPSLMPTQRFMIFGQDPRAAKTLAESTIPALLPPDIALVLDGNQLILDFTTRPFDEIEFERLMDLADQLAPRLTHN